MVSSASMKGLTRNSFICLYFSSIAIAQASTLAARKPISPNRFELLSGMSRGRNNEKVSWDAKFSKREYVFGKAPAKFLADNYHFIPKGAEVLDMGMGEGRNAVFLAKMGYKVTGVDISSVAVRKAKALAREAGVRINTIVASMNNYEIPANSLDAVIVYYYVDQELNEKIMRWLKPGGILVYEAHTLNQRNVKGSERYNKKHLLNPGELIKLFPGQILKYEEPLHEDAFRASIIVKKS